MAGKKKKLNAKKKAENQKHVEHRRQREEEEASKPKSFNEPGPSSAPGYAKRQDDRCSAKSETRRVPSNSQTHHSEDLLDSSEEEMFGLEDRIDHMNFSQASDSDQEVEFPYYATTGIAIANLDPTTCVNPGSENDSTDLPKFESGSGYIRTVSLAEREVNKLSRPSHMDLYNLYFQLSTVLENLSNYTVQVLVSKNKGARKPFLKKLVENDINKDLQEVLDGLPEYQESHRKPIDIEEYQALPDSKKVELQYYINNLPPRHPHILINEPNNVEYFIQGEGEEDEEEGEGEGVLTNNEFPNPFMRVEIENPENEEAVFSNQPNILDLSLPRLSILAALVGQKRSFKRVRPALTNRLIVDSLPKRFLSKFINLMCVGFYLLGKLIIESLSPDEKINRGNVFEFQDGDVGFWWAGVIILDWNEYLLRNVHSKPKHRAITCVQFIKTVGEGTIAFKAMLNLGPDGLVFTEQDHKNFQETVEKIKHKRLLAPKPEGADDDTFITIPL